MRFRLEGLDDQHDVAIHEVDKADLDLIAAECMALRSAGMTKTSDGDWHVMKADGWTINDWCVRKGVTFAQFMRDRLLQDRFINDPDNSAFRIHTGRI